jgi:hypothetical protein
VDRLAGYLDAHCLADSRPPLSSSRFHTSAYASRSNSAEALPTRI